MSSASAKKNVAAKFISSELWDLADWQATTFKWHPSSASPPIMGIVFENALPAHNLFGVWNKARENEDSKNELHISIIEGQVSEKHIGYIIHIYANILPVDSTVMESTDSLTAKPSLVFSRVNRMYPKNGESTLLERFKQEYQRHGEYLLAPATRRDEKDWVDVELGIVKTQLTLRRIEDIRGGDVDMVALKIARSNPPEANKL